MAKIYKYKIGPNEKSEIKDRILNILKIDWQGEDLCAWCLVSEDCPESRIRFVIIPTGYPFKLKKNLKYIDTVQDGPFVWHIFYELVEQSGGDRNVN